MLVPVVAVVLAVAIAVADKVVRALPQQTALGRVPVVLDCVVRPPRQELGDLGPFVVQLLVSSQEDGVLGVGPRDLADRRVQLVVPALTTLHNGKR